MNQVAMKVRADIADAIAVDTASAAETSEEATSPSADVAAALREYGANLHAMHPRAADPELRSWFVVEVPDERSAALLATSLLGLDGVQAAYEQPPAELP